LTAIDGPCCDAPPVRQPGAFGGSTVDKLITLGLSGAVTGAIYSLVASGIVLSYTATGIFNFSHGAIAYMAAVVFYELHQGLGWPIVPAALMTILVFAPLLGLALDALVFRRLAHVSETARIVATASSRPSASSSRSRRSRASCSTPSSTGSTSGSRAART
jgi:hypothetical protein